MTVPRNYRKRASEQVSELSLTAARLGRTHPARLGSAHPARLGGAHPARLGGTHTGRLGTTRPARLGSALSPGSTLHPQQGRMAAGVLTSANTYTDVDPYIWSFT